MSKRSRATQAKSTRGWARSAPKTKSERQALKKRCGARAFLQPGKLKFPVVAKGGSTCEVDCRALLAALSRSTQTHHPTAHKKALAVARRAGCRWAR